MSVRYTVKIFPTLSKAKEREQPFSFDVDLIKESPVLSLKPRRLIHVRCMRHNNRIVDFIDDVKGSVCICDVDNVHDVDQVEAVAKEKGAEAIFLLHDPSVCLLPSFKVSAFTMRKLSNLRGARIVFKQCEREAISKMKTKCRSPPEPSWMKYYRLVQQNEPMSFTRNQASSSKMEPTKQEKRLIPAGKTSPDSFGFTSELLQEEKHSLNKDPAVKIPRRSPRHLDGNASKALRSRLPELNDIQHRASLTHEIDLSVSNKAHNDTSQNMQNNLARHCSQIHLKQNKKDDSSSKSSVLKKAVEVPENYHDDIQIFYKNEKGFHIDGHRIKRVDTRDSTTEHFVHGISYSSFMRADIQCGMPQVQFRDSTENRQRNAETNKGFVSHDGGRCSPDKPLGSTRNDMNTEDKHHAEQIVKDYSRMSSGKSKCESWSIMKFLPWHSESIFERISGWDLAKDLSNYVKVLSKVDKALSFADVKRQNEHVEQAIKFLNGESWSISHFIAAAYVCMNARPDLAVGLVTVVFSCVYKVGRCSPEIQMLKMPTQVNEVNKMPHNVLFNFLIRYSGKRDHADSFQKNDDEVLNILVFLEACGLFRRPFTCRILHSVSQYVSPNFVERQDKALIALFGIQRMQTIFFCSQTSLNGFRQVACTLMNEGETLALETFLSKIIILHFENQSGDQSSETDFLASWTDVLFLLENVSFRLDSEVEENSAYRTKILRTVLEKACFGRCKTFKLLLQVKDMIHSSHRDAQIFKNVFKGYLARDIKTQDIPCSSAKILLSESMTDILPSHELGLLLLGDDFLSMSMFKWPAFEEKTEFLGLAYSKFFECFDLSNVFQKRILIMLQQAVRMENSASFFALKVLAIAAQEPSLFVSGSKTSDSFVEQVAEVMIPDSAARLLLENPGMVLCENLVFPDAWNTPLCEALLQRLCITLKSECNDISEAARLYQVVIKGSESSLPLLNVVDELFVHTFGTWKPMLMTDFCEKHKEVLDAMFLNQKHSAEPTGISNFAGDKFQSIEDCRRHSRALCQQWLKLFHDDCLSQCDLKKSMDCVDCKLWNVLANHYGLELPKHEEVAANIKEFVELECSIKEKFKIDNGKSIVHFSDLLREYGCFPEQDELIYRLLLDYQYLFIDQNNGATSSCKSLHDVRWDCNLVSAFRNENDDTMCLCAFFHGSPSILFKEALFAAKTQEQLSYRFLVNSVKCAGAELRNLFGPGSTFAGVNRAVAALSALKSASAIEADLKAVFQCPLLSLKEEDIDAFYKMAMICKLYRPLQGFIFCANHFHFAITNSDSMFANVKKIFNAFFGTDVEVKTRNDCLGVLSELTHLISGGKTEEIPSNSMEIQDGFGIGNAFCKVAHFLCSSKSEAQCNVMEDHDKLGKVLVLFELFLVISACPEVWSFTEEMKWFGEEGLKRFYNEYSNVTNVLLGTTGSYEMSLLDAVEPTIRCLSAVGGYHKTQSNMLQLFETLTNHKDIKEAIQGDFERNVRQVHSKLSEIKEWFSSGVDDVAATHSLYEAACRAGWYVICEHERNPRNPNAEDIRVRTNHVLTAQFFLDKDGTKENRKLSRDDLEQFILQISLIQDESPRLVSDMKKFVDQYQILFRSAQNVLQMHAVGYEEFLISDFNCRSGPKYVDQALQLLNETVIHLNKCEQWLQAVRRMYKVSLLFWVDELRSINEVAARLFDAESASVINEITTKTSRLMAFNKASIDHTFRSEIVRQWALNRTINKSESCSWLADASRFVQDLFLRFDGESSVDVLGASTIVFHSITNGEQDKPLATLLILRYIYKDRLPFSFEVFDGAIINGIDYVTVFLERVKKFPANRFVIINFELLGSTSLERIVKFLSTKENASLGINLHVILQENACLPSAPWILKKSWDSDVIAMKFNASFLSNWKDLVIDNQSFESITVVPGLNGIGKTSFIRQELERIRSTQGMQCEVGTLVLHEGSTVGSVVRDLLKKFTEASPKHSIHVSFLFLPNGSSRCDHWLREMNYFFFSALILGNVYDPVSGTSFSFADGKWDLFIELPETINGHNVNHWLMRNMPALYASASIQEISKIFMIDQKARRVCTYLRALDTGTIDRKFQGGTKKRIVFALDRSGSMAINVGNGTTAFQAVLNNAVGVYDKCIGEDDEIGVILFDHVVRVEVPIQVIGSNHSHIRNCILHSHFSQGGTNMYAALSHALQLVNHRDRDMETWIVCLTDGAAVDTDESFRLQFLDTPIHFHLITIGINLEVSLETKIRFMCNRYQPEGVSGTKGFFVRANADARGIDEAFEQVKQCIPVSKTFDLDGKLSDEDCRKYISKFLPKHINSTDMISQTFWIHFLYRRVKVFDENNSFNYNETYDALGSTLMQIMLDEVEQLLTQNQSVDWLEKNYTQLIYDFSTNDSPEFRLMCTAPEKMDCDVKLKLENLKLPGFFVPTQAQLKNRATLDQYLSQAIGIPLQIHEDGTKYLECITSNRFILTVDFAIKLLLIHERVECGIPCIIEGETGVSKTALTKMYSILRNSGLAEEARNWADTALEDIELRLLAESLQQRDGNTVSDRLRHMILNDPGQDSSMILSNLLRAKADSRPGFILPFLCSNPNERSLVEASLDLLTQFIECKLENTFFEINVDSSMTADDFITLFQQVILSAEKLANTNAVIVVFLDEINTSSVIGLLKEVVIDHSISGVMLPSNVVIVAACNPARATIQTSTRDKDLGKDWASGHYQVARLPVSMDKLKWSFGSLRHELEKEFIYQRLKLLDVVNMPQWLRAKMTEIVSAAHEAMRLYARKNILESMLRNNHAKSRNETLAEEAETRAQSVVSLRDIQRVFSLYEFFSNTMCADLCGKASSLVIHQKQSMLLSVALVYYLRLDSASRANFASIIDNVASEDGKINVLPRLLNHAMNRLLKETTIPPGIASTRGLKENIFATFVCLMSRIPLMIVGPPGCSKTLSVNIIGDNANGTDSINCFYSTRPRLSMFHYQCSKQSTSKEIHAVFDKASQRQDRIDDFKHRCAVFMDEAGLPEEEKESLKVLHYLLEGHMSTKAKVGFVAISNHVLDAAKSNRCVMLLREEPDHEEMLSIASGVLFDWSEDMYSNIHEVDLDGALIPPGTFAAMLCTSYSVLMSTGKGKCGVYNTFFGLRDFIYFLKEIRTTSEISIARMQISLQMICYAIERNFNGVTSLELREVFSCFLLPLATSSYTRVRSPQFERFLRLPTDVLKDALASKVSASNPLARARFKLIIDSTDDDSILRILKVGNVVEATQRSLCKLSYLPEEVNMEELRLISRVKFAALQGHLAVLSQTDNVNESFYDLFNQRFTEVIGRSGGTTLYANIAVGGISRRSIVQPEFQCVVQIRESKLHEIPAPFLNRFEKYRLDMGEVLRSGWSRFGRMAALVEKAKTHTSQLASFLQASNGPLGWLQNEQTIDSVFIDMLPQLDDCGQNCGGEQSSFKIIPGAFIDVLSSFLSSYSKIKNISSHVDYCIEVSFKVMKKPDLNLLELLCEESSDKSSIENALQTILHNATNGSLESKLIEALIQMTLTRAATFRLIQIATPEAIFVKRPFLPPGLLQKYFDQEHFSLKRLMKRLTDANLTESRYIVVHTRTDHYIHCIPRLPPDHCFSTSFVEAYHVTKQLIHEEPDSLVIEHLANLPSESLLRSFFDTWLKHKTRNILLLLIDMGVANSQENTNFIRMYAELQIADKIGKKLVLLLHYPPSSHKGRCYPALFLAGWEHIFLDCVGNLTSSFDINKVMIHAFRKDYKWGQVRDNITSDTLSSIKALLPKILTNVATQGIFYARQEQGVSSLFEHRKNILNKIMLISLGDSDIGEILSENFLALWLDKELVKSTTQASRKLLLGTTQLALSLSVQSVLVQSFHLFLTNILVDMNQWCNLDLILHSSNCNEAAELYEMILRDLPVAPFEELINQKNHSKAHLVALPDTFVNGFDINFPFFYLVSSYVDKLVAITEGLLAPKATDVLDARQVFSKKPVDFDVYLQTAWGQIQVDNLSESTSDRQNLRCVVLRAIEFVKGNDSGSLFDIYLNQFIEWKVGCPRNGFMDKWIKTKLKMYSSEKNILALHVFTRFNELELLQMASTFSIVEARSHCLIAGSVTKLLKSVLQNVQSLGGYALFTTIVEHFWSSLQQVEEVTEEFRKQFFVFLQGAKLLLSEKHLQIVPARRLRIISFVCVCLNDSINELRYIRDREIKKQTIRHCLEEQDGTNNSCDLPWLLTSSGISGDERSFATCLEVVLSHFFSTSWIELTDIFWEDDFDFLLSCLQDNIISKSRSSFFAELLKNASRFGSGRTHLSFSEKALFKINTSMTKVLNLVAPNPDKENAFSHYIPEWLQSNNSLCNEIQRFKSQDVSHESFFSSYFPSISGLLPDLVFHMFLGTLLEVCKSSSSEKVFLDLSKAIHSELSNDNSQACISSIETESNFEWYRGSPLSSICLSTQLVYFVAMVANDLGQHMVTPIFGGTYAEDAKQFLEVVMSLKQARWQEFFVATILRIRGEGTLATALGKSGPLRDMHWCVEWSKVNIEAKAEAINRLRRTEEELAETARAEEQKTKQFRLCPHCHQPFIVAQTNCGTFACGRDAHLLASGRPHLAGVAVQNTYGCGREFHVNSALQYVTDTHKLDYLRQKVNKLSSNLKHCEEVEAMVAQARALPIPVIAHGISRESPSIFPTSVLQHSRLADGTVDAGSPTKLAELLWDASKLDPFLFFLPDLIEFYLWLHCTFRYLLTKEQAYGILMGDLMSQDRLSRRFDATQVHHILMLWDRVRNGMNMWLAETEGKMNWQCDEISVPFSRLEDATLIALLSEGKHPTDGNDILFLFIDATIEKYNDFVRKLLGAISYEQDSAIDIILQPKFIVRGYLGASAVASVIPFSKEELNLVMASSWDFVTHEYDGEKLRSALEKKIWTKSRPPIIASPLCSLREEFCFRIEQENSVDEAYVSYIKTNGNGLFFANEQDFQLVNELELRLQTKNIAHGDSEYLRVLIVTFHDLEYETIRALLQGCCNFLDLFKVGDENFDSLGSQMQDLLGENDYSKVLDRMVDVGFPELKQPQSKIIRDLGTGQFFELIKYLSHQLASEGYLFANLPLCMTAPLNDNEKQKIKENMDSFFEESPSQMVAKHIDEFAINVLSFYESEIRAAATKTNCCMRLFLSENNFCDDSDPIFISLPTEVTIYHYVSLRQLLNQIKLSILGNRNGQKTKSTTKEIATSAGDNILRDFAEISPGRCWLWEEDGCVSPNHKLDNTEGIDHMNLRKLWFETEMNDSFKDEMDIIKDKDVRRLDPHEDFCDDGCSKMTDFIKANYINMNLKASVVLQRWWRKQVLQRRSKAIYYDQCEVMSVESLYSTNSIAALDSYGFKRSNSVIEEDNDSISSESIMSIDRIQNTEHHVENLYGGNKELNDLKEWLNMHALPQSLLDKFVQLGVRSVGDLVMLVRDFPQLLEDFAPLDRFKLKASVDAYSLATNEQI